MTKITKERATTIAEYVIHPSEAPGWDAGKSRVCVAARLRTTTFADKNERPGVLVFLDIRKVGKDGVLGEDPGPRANVRFQSEAVGYRAARGKSVHCSPESARWVLERISEHSPLAAILRRFVA